MVVILNGRMWVSFSQPKFLDAECSGSHLDDNFESL